MKKYVIFLAVLTFGIFFEGHSQRISRERIRDLVPSRETIDESEKPDKIVRKTENATVYPGAAERDRSNTESVYGSHYTDDPVEDVHAYYYNEAGNYRKTEDGDYLYDYKRVGMDFDRVRVSTSYNYVFRGVTDALRELSDAQTRGLISSDEYTEISREFNQVRGMWKSGIPAEDIFQSYYLRLNLNALVQEREEKYEREKGNMTSEEQIAYMRESAEIYIKIEELNNSREFVDEWIKCLEEMRESLEGEGNTWNVAIRISLL
ncbi:MAG: hypothetical protein EA408_05565 [Marinilabiliales bacterium]|nr:MAG: hypothetical protein EA408_05565 [Marinilabiliales bacterium]